VALLQRARFTTALAACGVGLAICGVTLAVAGESPKPPADPLSDLPGNIETVQNAPCDGSAAAAGGGFGPMACFHVLTVRSTVGETGTQLADRLADHYSRRGFPALGVIGGMEPRTYTAKNACQTMLTITTSPAGAISFGPNGAVLNPDETNGVGDPNNGLDPTGGIDPTNGQAGGVPPVSVPGAAATVPGAPPATTPGAAASTPVPTVATGASGARGLLGQAGPKTTVAPGAPTSGPPTTATATPGSRTLRRSGTPGASTTSLRPGSEPGGEVMLSAQVANTAGGLC
jgi:hypothetical protein